MLKHYVRYLNCASLWRASLNLKQKQINVSSIPGIVCVDLLVVLYCVYHCGLLSRLTNTRAYANEHAGFTGELQDWLHCCLLRRLAFFLVYFERCLRCCLFQSLCCLVL